MPSILPQNPIFIVGYPRSGTTLLQSLLVTQPGVYSFPETHYFSVIEKQAAPPPTGAIPHTSLPVLLDAIQGKLDLEFSQPQRDELERAATENRLTSKMVFEAIATHYLTQQGVNLEPPTSFLWIEKTPTHCNFIDRIRAFYPAAKIIHIVRHPVPAILSRRTHFPYNHDTPLADLAQSWGRMNLNVERHRNLSPLTIYSLKYEDLVAGVNQQMEQVGEFLRIRLDLDKLREFHQHTGSLATESEPWKQSSLSEEIANTNARYQRSAAREEVDEIEAILAEQMKMFGYQSFWDTHD